MGNKTIKRLAILIGVIALLGGGGYFLRAFQVERMAHGVAAKAEQAEKERKYDEAERLYREHLAVVPGDVEIQLKYAEAHLKRERSSKRQDEALMIFEDVLRQYPGREDVRRRAAELAFEMRLFERARSHVEILLRKAKDDGHLEYLMARCREEENEFDEAAKSYGAAIEHGAPERFEAAQQRALLLRDKLGRKDEADRVIDAMVESAPGDYRAYLGRGRYREGPGGKGGGDDFRKALELAPDRPEVYLEVARAVERESGSDAASQVLEKGVGAAPNSVELYSALSSLWQRAGRGDRAVEALELGLKVMPDEINLRWQLAMLLASRGETEAGRLLLQIEELKRLGAGQPLTQYLTAYYHFNNREVIRAKQILELLQPEVARIPAMKSAVNLLLARCYSETGDAEQQQDAMMIAVSTTPNDPTTRLGWIQVLIARGDVDGAIREYKALAERQPGIARLQRASLLIEQNRRLPKAQRRWDEAERLIREEEKAVPTAVEPALLRARLLVEQGADEAKVDDALDTIRARSPKDPRPWIAQAELRIRQRRFGEAEALLRRAREQVGDRVELRLARAQLAMARGGPQVVPTLNELAKGLESFSGEDRRRLLTALATELGRQQDLKGASAAWAQLARDERKSLQPRLHLFELALLSGDGRQAEEQIREVEGLDEQFGHLCRSQYLVWRARGAADPAEAKKLRGEARGLLMELRVRRPDSSRIPLALARLEEEELAEATDEGGRREKLESAITSYRRAIELGLRDPAVARHYIQLLFRAGRGGEALEIYNQMLEIARLSGGMERVASEFALANRDVQQAAEIARKAVATDPEDFQARVWLARVLMEEPRTDDRTAEAEDVIRKGIALVKTDPDRWITLVRFLVLTRQSPRAEEVVREAEGYLAAAPLALAQCCGVVGKAFELSEPDRAKAWYGRARGWYAKAQQALKDSDDPTVRRQLAEFLLQTNEAAEAEGPLKDIVARTADGKSPTLATWARRSLAQVYVTANPPRTAEALALFAGRPGQAGDPDDLRVLSLIHQAQGTPEGRRQAIGDLEALIRHEAARPEDRLRMARLLEAGGEWPRAREQFRELILRTDAARDAETITRRPIYLALFIEGLVRHHQPGDDSDLVEARQLVEKLRPTQRDPLFPLIKEIQIDKAAGQPDVAMRRIREFAARTDVSTAGRLGLADAAERLGLLDAAEWAYRRAADEPPPDRNSLPNKARLALFLARHGKVKDAVDLCEGLWAVPALREATAAVCTQMLCDTTTPVDAPQTRRVAGWFQRALTDDPQSMTYIIGLGNLYERLGEYPKAEEQYRTAIKINDRDGIASNNLAWLMALRDGKGDQALELINNAIRIKGPQPEYLDTRGMIYLAAGDWRHAIADLEAACRLAPTPPKYFHLAQAYLKLNEKEKARTALEAGKARGLPGGLHNLEAPEYRKVAGELGMK